MFPTKAKPSRFFLLAFFITSHQYQDNDAFTDAFHVGKPSSQVRSFPSISRRWRQHSLNLSGVSPEKDSDLASIAAYEEEEKKSRTDGKVTLKFFAEIAITSNAAPQPNLKSLHDFFALRETAPLLLRGSKNNKLVEIENPDSKLLDAYQRQCSEVKSAPPTPDDRIFDVTTSGVKFPGLQVMSVATIGVKMLSKKNNHSGAEWPYYEMVLIRDSTYATGSRFLVWLYDKMTGSTKGKKDDSEQTTQSFNRVGIVELDNGKIAFQSNANLGIQVVFPSLLMKMVPGGKEKTEESGSQSLRKVLADDVPSALEIFREAYLRWIEE